MAWYDTGSVAVTNGSTTVTGAGTDFISGVQVGEGLYIGGDLYEIGVINSSTQLTLSDAYLGSTATGQAYKIIPTQSLVADLSSGVADLISDFADVRDYAGNGKFNDGTQASPAITFTQDQNNGLYRIGSDNWGMSAGGAKALEIKTTGVKLDDGKKITFGASDDLQIYHDGSHSWIKDAGTGDLTIQGDNLYLGKGDGTKFLYGVSSTGQVRLYYGDAQKFITTSTGVDVTGTITADGLTVDGTINVGVVGSKVTFLTTGDATPRNFIGTTNDYHLTLKAGRGVTSQIDLTENEGIQLYGNSKLLANFDDTGDVSFYEDTGTTAKMVWDASAESLNVGSSQLNFSSTKVQTGSATSPASGFNVFTSSTGDGYLLFSDGNLGNQAYTGQIRYNHASDFMAFGTNGGSESMRIDSAGNVGIGTASPSGALDIGGQHVLNDNYDAIGAYFRRNGSYGSVVSLGRQGVSDGATLDYPTANTLGLSTGGSERARIDSSGNLLVGTTTHSSLSISGHRFVGGTGGYVEHVRTSTSDPSASIYLSRANNGNALLFYRNDAGGGTVGAISVTSSSTSYNTSSDERLKENIVDTTHSLNIDDIRVREFDWKVDGEHQRFGFIAQELETVYPEAVTSPEDEDEMKSVDYSKLVPLLVKEIQTLKARIETLEKK